MDRLRKYAQIHTQSTPDSKSPGVATGSLGPEVQNPPPRPPAFTSIEAIEERIPAHARLHTQVIVRIYEFEIEIIDPRTLDVLRRHSKGSYKGEVIMERKDRIFNPSRQTRHLLARAAAIGPNTKKLCQHLFDEQGRSGQRRMRGIVDMARKHTAAHIEQAARIALEKGINKCRLIRRIVTDIAKAEQAGSGANDAGLASIIFAYYYSD